MHAPLAQFAIYAACIVDLGHWYTHCVLLVIFFLNFVFEFVYLTRSASVTPLRLFNLNYHQPFQSLSH